MHSCVTTSTYSPRASPSCCMYLWLHTRALYSIQPSLECINYNMFTEFIDYLHHVCLTSIYRYEYDTDKEMTILKMVDIHGKGLGMIEY